MTFDEALAKIHPGQDWRFQSLFRRRCLRTAWGDCPLTVLAREAGHPVSSTAPYVAADIIGLDHGSARRIILAADGQIDGGADDRAALLARCGLVEPQS